jgi:hypothetical protein
VAAKGAVVQRIFESGVDLDHAYGRGLAWLAWLHRRSNAVMGLDWSSLALR